MVYPTLNWLDALAVLGPRSQKWYVDTVCTGHHRGPDYHFLESGGSYYSTHEIGERGRKRVGCLGARAVASGLHLTVRLLNWAIAYIPCAMSQLIQ